MPEPSNRSSKNAFHPPPLGRGLPGGDVNAYYDFKTNTSLTPYFGAGVGMLNGELEDNGISIDDNAFGYQVMVGTAYNMTKNLALDLSYRFQGAANDFSKEGIDISYNSSNIYAGIRYTF